MTSVTAFVENLMQDSTFACTSRYHALVGHSGDGLTQSAQTTTVHGEKSSARRAEACSDTC